MKYSLEEIKKLIKIIYNEHFKCSISMIIYSDDLEKKNVWRWYRAVEFYENTIGGKGKNNRLGCINFFGDNLLAGVTTKEQNMNVVSLCFDWLATKEYINLK